MTNKTTRTAQYIENRRIVFLAFELGNKHWRLGFTTGFAQKARERTIAARDLVALQAEVSAAKKRFGLPAASPVVSCYEAGRDGFWLHRYLVRAGIKNLVVDSSSIEVNRRSRRTKTDRLDAQKLLSMLQRYEAGDTRVWSVVRVPSVAEEDRRHLHRALFNLKKETTRVTNRIKGLMAAQGILLPSPLDLSDKRIDAIRLWDGSPLPPELKKRLRREWSQLLSFRKQIREVEAERCTTVRDSEDPALRKVRQLSLLRGIGLHGSWVFVREFFGWRKFNNRRQVAAAAGLTPTHYQSGETTHEQGISRAGNSHVRTLAVELAWMWVRHQPNSKITQWYLRRFVSGSDCSRKLGIVALARRLLIELWRFLETGAIPEGAVLKVQTQPAC